MMKLTSICSIVCLLIFLGCNKEAPKETSTLSLEELGEQFIVAANAGDLAAIDSLYITEEDFAATFSGEGLSRGFQGFQEAFKGQPFL